MLVCKIIYTPNLFQPQHKNNPGAANWTIFWKHFNQTEHCFPSMFKILFSHFCKKWMVKVTGWKSLVPPPGPHETLLQKGGSVQLKAEALEGELWWLAQRTDWRHQAFSYFTDKSWQWGIILNVFFKGSVSFNRTDS